MSRMIMPAFERFPEEAALLGRLLAGYGEIEYELTQCLAAAIDDDNAAFRAMFRMRTESQRIDVADALMRDKYDEANLASKYADAIGAIRACRNIRNQYAHCHWLDFPDHGLFFTNLQKATEKSGKPLLRFHHIDPPLLQKQEAYFCYAADCFVFLSKELTARKGRLKTHAHSMPKKMQPPNLYNPPETHPLPQLPIGNATPQ